jgi:hypothetical protein
MGGRAVLVNIIAAAAAKRSLYRAVDNHPAPVLAGVNALRCASTRCAGFGVDVGSAPG